MEIHLRRSCKRRKMLTLELPRDGITGVSRANISFYSDTILTKFRGFFPKHLLILVRQGSVISRRDGDTLLGEPGDVLLVPKGEAEIEFVFSRESHGFVCEVIEFDERSIAKILRGSHWAETAAIRATECPKVGIKFPALRLHLLSPIMASITERFAPELVLERIFDDLRHLSAPFSREVFYEARWKVLRFLESHLWESHLETTWHEEYEGGAKQLEKDCRFYVGCGVDVFVRRRKVELATNWLRCGCRIDDIAQALHFTSRFEFHSIYSGTTKRRAVDVGNPNEEPALHTYSIEQLEEEISPFWWRKCRHRHDIGEFQKFLLRRMSQKLQEAERRSRTAEVQVFERLRNRRALVDCNETAPTQPDQTSQSTDARKGPDEFPNRPLSYAPPKVPTPEFNKAAQEFFEMKTTGIEVVVPFFKDAPVQRPKAA